VEDVEFRAAFFISRQSRGMTLTLTHLDPGLVGFRFASGRPSGTGVVTFASGQLRAA